MEPDIFERLAQLRLVPVVELADAAVALPLSDALLAGGLPCMEITFRTPAAAAAIAMVSRMRPQILLGAGTVLSTSQADIAIAAGAQFIVSPGFDRRVVRHCVARSVQVIPGVVTPTEVQSALAHGLRVVKFFPAEAAGGAAYLRSLTAPFPDIRFIPTGGINVDNLEGYLRLSEVIAVGGSWMVSRDLLNRADFETIERRVREAVTLVRGWATAGDGSGSH